MIRVLTHVVSVKRRRPTTRGTAEQARRVHRGGCPRRRARSAAMTTFQLLRSHLEAPAAVVMRQRVVMRLRALYPRGSALLSTHSLAAQMTSPST